MKSVNMGAGKRACAYFLVILLVDLQLVTGKPFFGAMFCDFLCDDYDDDDDDDSGTSTTTSLDDLLDLFDPCGDCPTRRPATPVPPTMAPGMPPPMPFTFMPPPEGMNVTMTNDGSKWFMNFMPLGGGPGAPSAPGTPPAATTPAPAATTTAGATTAAPEATTAAAATTAAP